MTDASAWFALGGALGGVALTGAFSLAVSGLTHRWGERARVEANLEAEATSRREQLREACHGYLTAATIFYHAVHYMYLKAIDDKPFDPWEDVREQLTAMQDQYVFLTISSAAEVRTRASAYNKTLYGLADAARAKDEAAWSQLDAESYQARDELRAAMRSALGIDD